MLQFERDQKIGKKIPKAGGNTFPRHQDTVCWHDRRGITRLNRNDERRPPNLSKRHNGPPTEQRPTCYLRYEELSTPQLEALDKDRAVVLLPLGPLEEHGPHLPFGVDAFNADFFADEVARMIAELDPAITVVRLPVLYLGTHVYRFGGSLWTRQRVVRDAVVDYGRSLARHGFKKIIIISAHGGPRHFVALDEAARIVSRRGARMISLTSRVIVDFLLGRYVEAISERMGTPLSAEEKKTLTMDYHGGWWETSMMLWLKPHLVDPMYKTLSPALIPRHRLRPNSPLVTGPGLGYLGAPAKASAEFAHASIAALRVEIGRMLREFLAGTLDVKSVRSQLYYVPLLRTNYKCWLWGIGMCIAGLAAVLLLLWNR